MSVFLSPIGQLLSGEGACVTFYTLESLERGGMVVGDFGASLEMIIGPRSGPGSESSEDSEGVVSPTAMIIKSALRDYLLCLQCCMTKSKRLLP